MKELNRFLYNKVNLLVCIILTIIMVLYAWLIMGSQSKCIGLPEGTSLLGLRFGYKYESVFLLFHSMSANSLKCYATLLTVWDNLFPFIYGSMYVSWISLLYKNYRFKYESLSYINLYPILPLVTDLIENYVENGLVTSYMISNNVSLFEAQLASIITQLKWSFSSLNYIIILVGIILFFKNKKLTTIPEQKVT